ncbi:tyrosine-type recombinase/integrase [Jeotgalibacillus salarius]|uniref:Site-specific integrase n=1 Tax=Jeotgalibacillus salarius TaxID=546023 RepID=A0A4Y8LIK2_9BACL|nr:site-specific integrase [Jeotgalibacillus salarius]TFE02854.1 site-specific integrase [Jeotgalibacillus salarius]
MASFRRRGCTCTGKKRCTCGAKWEYRLRYKDPIENKFREATGGGFTSKAEAILAADKRKIELEEGYDQSEDMTLEAYLQYWLTEYKKDSVRKNTLITHQTGIKKRILPYFKNVMLSKITPMMYQKFLNSLHENEYSKRTIEITHSTMNNALAKAEMIGKIKKNPCTNAVIKGKTKKQEIDFIDSGDISEFLTQAHKYGYIYWIFFKTLIETGMRKGEAAALQWTDIDLKAGTININKTLDFDAKPDEELFGDPKTYKSSRVVTIRKSLINDLHFHMKWQNQNKLALKELYRHDINLVFCRNDGDIMPKSSLFNAFERILKRSELPKLRIHSLRHTHVVLQMEAGASMKYIQERLGHDSEQITSQVYAHISKRIETESMDRFEAYAKDILD